MSYGPPRYPDGFEPGDSGVRADPPGNAAREALIYAGVRQPDPAMEAAFAATDDAAVWAQAKGSNAIARLTRRSILNAALDAAAPVIAAQVRAEADALIAQAEDHARQEEERFESVMADFVADLPPCPNCGCRTSDEADCRDCGCDIGCNDGDWHPGVNVIAAQAARDERQRIYDAVVKILGRPYTATDILSVFVPQRRDLLDGAEMAQDASDDTGKPISHPESSQARTGHPGDAQAIAAEHTQLSEQLGDDS